MSKTMSKWVALFGLPLFISGCASKYEAQKELASTPPLEEFQLSGNLDDIARCLTRTGASLSLTRSANKLYVVPTAMVAETTITQAGSNQLGVVHRATGRTIGGSPLGWEYLELITKCAEASGS